MKAGRCAICILAVQLFLAGCAAEPGAPLVEKVYVPVPVVIVCEPPPEPDYAVRSLPIGAPIDEQVRALLEEREQRKGYITELKGECR